MAKQYSKTKLAKFRKSIEEKMGIVSEDVDTIREGLGLSLIHI